MKTVKFALLCGLVLAIAAPAFAGEEEEGNSWYLGFDIMAQRASGLPGGFVLDDPDDDSSPEGDLVSVEPSYDLGGRIWAGYSWGEDGALTFVVSSVTSEENERVSSSSGGELWDILFHADDAFEDFTGFAEAEMETEAMSIDIVYSRPIHQGEKFNTWWMAGLRYGNLDHDLNVIYDDGGTPERVELGSETMGIGPRIGMGAGVKLCKSVWVGAGGSFSYLSGDSETSTYNNDGGSPEADFTQDVDLTFSVVDAWVGLKWSITDFMALRFGYEYSQWNNALTTNLNPDDIHEGFVQSDTTDVSWDGFFLGLGFNFGG